MKKEIEIKEQIAKLKKLYNEYPEDDTNRFQEMHYLNRLIDWLEWVLI